MAHTHNHSHHDHKYGAHQLDLKKRKTALVLIISLVTMVLEIVYGYSTNSMALLSDGWHMSSHVVAIGASWLAYQYVIYKQANGQPVNTAKTLSYVGLFNAIALIFIAVHVIIECIERFNNPLKIIFDEAIAVAIIGLVVNLLSVKILHHHEEHSDQNLRAAYMHVLADVLTSALALVALTVGYFTSITNIDTAVGLLGGLVILNWSRSIITQSIKEIKHESEHEHATE